MMRTLFIWGMQVCLAMPGLAQDRILSGAELRPPHAVEQVYAMTLHSDEHSSTFVIWVKDGVALHKHAFHTETVLVLKGRARMQLGEEVKVVKKGDLILIPPGTPHSVKTLSRRPVKVLSVQAPQFNGDDRILLEY